MFSKFRNKPRRVPATTCKLAVLPGAVVIIVDTPDDREVVMDVGLARDVLKNLPAVIEKAENELRRRMAMQDLDEL